MGKSTSQQLGKRGWRNGGRNKEKPGLTMNRSCCQVIDPISRAKRSAAMPCSAAVLVTIFVDLCICAVHMLIPGTTLRTVNDPAKNGSEFFRIKWNDQIIERCIA